MNKYFALKILKGLVSEDKFCLVNRRAPHAKTVTSSVVKIVVDQLTINDFVEVREDKKFAGEYLWIYEADVGITYYIKCKFSSGLDMVKFVSFHKALY